MTWPDAPVEVELLPIRHCCSLCDWEVFGQVDVTAALFAEHRLVAHGKPMRKHSKRPVRPKLSSSTLTLEQNVARARLEGSGARL